jgi:hypothetical protein
MKKPITKKAGGVAQGVDPSSFKRQYQKKKKKVFFRARDMPQVVEPLPSKLKVLSSNSRTRKKKSMY